MNYRVVLDERVLKPFIDWLPDLEPDETYYVCLLARAKYCKEIVHIKSDKVQMKRFTSNKERLFEKIKQLECPYGFYRQKVTTVIPQEALALYITPNPRSFLKAGKQALIKLSTLIGKPYDGWNPHQEMMSEIQKAKSRSVFVDFDFDDISFEEVEEDILKNINKEAISILNTRGGFHCLVETSKINSTFRSKWYNELVKVQQAKSSDKDNRGDGMIPVPGCVQGNFMPHFKNI